MFHNYIGLQQGEKHSSTYISIDLIFGRKPPFWYNIMSIQPGNEPNNEKHANVDYNLAPLGPGLEPKFGGIYLKPEYFDQAGESIYEEKIFHTYYIFYSSQGV